MATEINLFDPSILDDPFPTLNALREAGDGIHNFPEVGAWALLRYEHVAAAYKDPDSFSSQLFWVSPASMHDDSDPLQVRFVEAAQHNILFQDPPEHTRLRNLVRKAFTPRAVKSMRERIGQVVEELLDGLVPGEEVDFMDAFAEALPVTAIAEMLGVPIEDRRRFRELSGAAASTLEPGVDPERRKHAIHEVAELSDYLEALVERRRAKPGEDLLSGLLAAEEEGDKLTMDELGAMVVMLLVAGNETTTNLLGNGLSLLLDHPDQRRRLIEDPGLVPGAIEEMLRFVPPLIFNGRLTTREVTFGEQTLPETSLVVLGIGAANRDPRQFDDPDTFDVARPAPKHLSFGHGIHFCLGAALARLEASIAFPALLARVPDMESGEAPRVVKHDLLSRGFAELPVRA